MNERFFATRHSIKPKGEDMESADFPGISEKGVERAKERAAALLVEVENLEAGTVVFLGGVSEAVRTRSTAEVYGEEMKRLVAEQGREDVLVYLPEDIASIEGFTKKVEFLVEQAKAHPTEKLVLDIPLFVKEFGMNDRWMGEDGGLSAYTKELLKRNNNNEQEALKDWLETQGVIGDLVGPNPKQVAQEQLAGIERLRAFAQKFIPGRPLVIGSVGHSLNLDALAVYLANNGEVTKEAFENMQAKMIGETKMVKISEQDGRPVLQYGDVVIPLETN